MSMRKSGASNSLVSAKQATPPPLNEIFDYPQYTIRGITTWEQIAILGRENIRALIKSARYFERQLSERIKELTRRKSVIEGKDGSWFQEEAKKFENPQDMVKGFLDNNWLHEPEPIDQKSREREAGATTFNICGWCKYANSGTCRYSYHITTNCALLTAEDDLKFDTPCRLHNSTRADLQTAVEGFNKEISDCKRKRDKVRRGIRHLQSLEQGAPSKPYLMSLRPHDHFNVGDEMVINLSGFQRKTVEGEWAKAICVFGYRHQDGCISGQGIFPIHNNLNYLDGRGVSFGMSRPECFLAAEFYYLRDAFKGDYEFLRIWMDNIEDKLEGFDQNQFQLDLIEGKFAEPPADWQPPSDEIRVESVQDALNVLQMLMEPENLEQLDRWVKMQLRYVHPDKHHIANEAVKAYAQRQTRAVYAARKLLKARLESKSISGLIVI